MNANDLYSAIKKGVNRELKMFDFPMCDARTQIVDAATAVSFDELTATSSESDIRRVTRRIVRKLVGEGKHRKDVPLDAADITEESGACFMGNGAYPASSLNARNVDDIDAEDELIDHIDRKRRLMKFIDAVGIETWRWLLHYWRASRKPHAVRDRVRFHRLKKIFLETV